MSSTAFGARQRIVGGVGRVRVVAVKTLEAPGLAEVVREARVHADRVAIGVREARTRHQADQGPVRLGIAPILKNVDLLVGVEPLEAVLVGRPVAGPAALAGRFAVAAAARVDAEGAGFRYVRAPALRRRPAGWAAWDQLEPISSIQTIAMAMSASRHPHLRSRRLVSLSKESSQVGWGFPWFFMSFINCYYCKSPCTREYFPDGKLLDIICRALP